MPTHAILVHGLGRMALSMRPLAKQLKLAGIQPHSFSYVAAFEDIDHCTQRLQRFIEQESGGEPYILIGHSLGTVLLRLVASQLDHQPNACFFLAPPTVACRAAKYFAKNPLFRIAAGEMGQLLSNDKFMSTLPVPHAPTTMYVGTAGPRGRWLPFKNEKNDGILAVSETIYPTARVEYVPALHTFIMRSKPVIKGILATLKS